MRADNIQNIQDDLMACSERVSKLIWEEYSKDDSPFRFQSSFTTDQFEVILALIGMYSSSLIIEFYKHLPTAGSSGQPIDPQPQASFDAVD